MLPETKIIRNNYVNLGTKWNYKNMCYPYNSLYFVTGGDGYIKVDGVINPLKAGKVYLIPTNMAFSVWCDSFISKFFVDVTLHIVAGYDIFDGVKEVLSMDCSIEKIMSLIKLNDNPTVKNLIYLQSEIEKVLSCFLPEDYDFDISLIEFKPMLDYISTNISARLKVSDIALKYHWNICVLSRKFKSVFGVTLKVYISNLLLSKIKQELIFTQKSIKEIAQMYDFCDQYYMSGFFKKFTTLSPKQYRKASILFRLDE